MLCVHLAEGGICEGVPAVSIYHLHAVPVTVGQTLLPIDAFKHDLNVSSELGLNRVDHFDQFLVAPFFCLGVDSVSVRELHFVLPPDFLLGGTAGTEAIVKLFLKFVNEFLILFEGNRKVLKIVL